MSTRSTRRRRLVGVVGATLAGLVLAACGSDGGSSGSEPSVAPPTNTNPALEPLIKAAQAEGSLEVWGVLNPDHLNAVAKAFEATYGIKTTITAYSPADVVTRVDAEQSSKVGSQDVLLQTDRVWHAQHQGYFAEITGPDVLAADELVRDGAKPVDSEEPIATQALYSDNTRVASLYAPWGYAWRKDAVDSDPSFEDLFSGDTFKQAIGMNDPEGNPPTTALYYNLLKRYPDLFDRLGDLKPTLYPLSGPAAEGLAAGAVDAVLAISAAAVSQLDNVGFAYDDSFPALATPVYAEILKSSKSPNAAQLFVNWLLTPAGQEAWCAGYASVLPDISTATLSSSELEVYDASSIDSADLEKTVEDFNEAIGR